VRIAIVDEELPYPLNSGKRIRTFQLISRLARRHRITYICHRNADPTEAESAGRVFRELGIEVIVADRVVPSKSGPRFYGRLAANLLSPLPYSVASHMSDSLSAAIAQVSRRGHPELWQAEWTPYAESIDRLATAPRMIMAHNVESQIWLRYYENETNPAKRWYIGHQWRKFDEFERRTFQAANQVVAVSHEDAALIRDQFRVNHVRVVENGVDTSYFQPSRSTRERGLILFLGSLDWRPNLDAVDQLLTAIFPLVAAQDPSARLCVVGRNPPIALMRRVETTPGVELHANVSDVRPFLARSSVMVVPLRIGGGSRLKILEAFAAGLPVISTQIGAEGLRVQEGRELKVVQRLKEMADEIVAALKNPDPGLLRALRGRQLVEREYDWDILAKRLETLWSQSANCVSVGCDRNGH
jgi:glycosyltransferase involved in cell wall biosynthesis